MTRRNNSQLREDYLKWLEPQLRDEHGAPEKTFWGLLNLMFDTPFSWNILMDENRLAEGLELRVEFARKNHIRLPLMEKLGPGSFLEVLIGLSRQLEFHAGGQAPGWAWQLLNNLELHRLSDPLTRPKQRRAEEVMITAMARGYSPDGNGGFFPLAWPDGDQTRIELWNQMHAFIAELHPEH